MTRAERRVFRDRDSGQRWNLLSCWRNSNLLRLHMGGKVEEVGSEIEK